jgi:hypothetical protein
MRVRSPFPILVRTLRWLSFIDSGNVIGGIGYLKRCP